MFLSDAEELQVRFFPHMSDSFFSWRAEKLMYNSLDVTDRLLDVSRNYGNMNEHAGSISR